MKISFIFAASCVLTSSIACSGGDENGLPESAEEVGTTSAGLVTTLITYDATPTGGSTCSFSRNIRVVEPDLPGSYPVFIYAGGSGEVGPNGTDFSDSTIRIVNEAARQGFVAAAIAYEDSLNLNEDQCLTRTVHFKAQCVYSTSFNPNSALARVCSRSKAAGCSLGVVTAGFSQGGAIAALARNFDTRVRGTWSMGFADVGPANNDQLCFDQGTGPLGPFSPRLLSNSRLRITNGVNQVGTNLQLTSLAAYNRTTGRNCSTVRGAGNIPVVNNCLNGPNGSGWKVALQSELAFGNPAGHCFLTNSFIVDCTGAGTDSVFDNVPPTTPRFASGMFDNISWLRNSILPLGNQP